MIPSEPLHSKLILYTCNSQNYNYLQISQLSSNGDIIIGAMPSALKNILVMASSEVQIKIRTVFYYMNQNCYC